MPQHTHYVEPYFGGGSVLFAKNPEGASEVVNDIDGALTNFWRVLADHDSFESFLWMAGNTPFSKVEFETARMALDMFAVSPDLAAEKPVRWAWSFFVTCRQSMMGMKESFAPLSKRRVRRGMNEQVSAWFGSIEGLPAVHERMRRVVIYNEKALDVISREDSEHTLFYLDPPYLHDTRVSTDLYAFEMSSRDHALLLKRLRTLKGKFMLSGYHSTLYDACAREWGWNCHEFDLPNNMGGGDSKRRMVECLWTNF